MPLTTDARNAFPSGLPHAEVRPHDPALRAVMLRDGVDELFQRMPRNVGLAVITALLLSLYFAGPYGIKATLIWLLGFVVARVTLPGPYWIARWLGAELPRSTRLWFRLYLVHLIAYGLYWSLGTMVLLSPTDHESVFYVALAMAASTSSGTMIHAFSRPMALAYNSACILPFAAWLMTHDQPSHTFVALGLGLWFVFLVLQMLNHEHTLLTTIGMRLDVQVMEVEATERNQALQRQRDTPPFFIAALSHDMRQPLQALSASLAALRAQPGVDPAVIERADIAAQDLHALVEGTLDVARLDAQAVPRNLRPVELSSMLRRLQIQHEPAAHDKGLSLRLRCTEGWVMSDALMLQRVIGNLIQNAIRYTDHGGVLVATRRMGALLRLQVFDTGVGIEAGRLATIFDAFVQGPSPTASEGTPRAGFGLGLAIVRRMCRLLDHPITVRSVPGRGSCFELLLPVVAPHDAARESGLVPPVDSQQPLAGHVLLIDDHTWVRAAMRQTLLRWGLSCDDAGTAEQALELSRQQRYDIVLSDLDLGGGTRGDQLLGLIAQMQPGLRVMLLLTGAPQDVTAPLPSGAEVLVKPVSSAQLRHTLSTLLARRV